MTSSQQQQTSLTVLLWLANKELKFRINDIVASSEAVGAQLQFDAEDAKCALIEPHAPDEPVDLWPRATAFLVARVRDEHSLIQLAQRSMMLMAAGELWCEAKSIDELLTRVEQLCVNERASELAAMANSTFRFDVQASCAKIARDEQVAIMKRLGAFFPLNKTAKVAMKNPQHQFHVIVEYEPSANDARGALRRCFFVRHLIKDVRAILDRYSLKTRRYIGTTSMDTEMSFMSANQALCKPGSMVLDPFVGTGALLVTAAHYGAYCLGTDIDPRVLHGKNGVSIGANFADYGFPQRLLGTMSIDLPKTALRLVPMWDAIITDPPYGVRAGARTVGMKAKTAANPNYKIPEGLPHFPQFLPYSLDDSLRDLLAFAARTLVLGGRLVYWLPTTSEFKESDFPLHPCFQLLRWSRQLLSGDTRRLLVTMEKTIEYDAAVHSNPDRSLLGQFGEPAHMRFLDTFRPGEEDDHHHQQQDNEQ